MAADEWRLCVDWLVKCKILPEDHRATSSDAQAFDLAQALRDGVLLCHLLNALKAYSVDPKDFSPRPQLSQFLCLKNIRTFLQTCEKTFMVKTIDLFDPPDLFDVKNFRKVLHTLSKLSKTTTSEGKVPGGFPQNNRQLRDNNNYNRLEDLALGFPPHNNHANDSEEDIYGNLSDMAIENDIEDNEDLYDSVYQEGDDEIYEDLCSTKKPRKRHVSNKVTHEETSELPPPVTKRDYCIKEMVDTERNYVDALRMIVQHFIKPMKSTLSKTDVEVIFSCIEPLQEVHTGFHSELYQACTRNKPKIHEVFIKWKTKFLLYGDYCSNLPKAQEHIEELTKKNEPIKELILECERKANDGRFRLRDLLHVPMQRVLKYHLLLRELMKNTDKSSEDQRYLQQALEAMQDLSLYVNEVKRDNEALQLIQEIQNSIVDLQMPQNTTLKDYGRLQKDGELKVKSHLDNRVKPRYIFLFDKVMLMGKSKGETYSFKEAIVLAEYKVDPTSSAKDAQKRASQWCFSFQMVKQDNALAYTFFAKTEDMKVKWIEAINLALDNTQPSAGKNFIMTTFTEAKVCDICGKLLRGVFFQGYTCPVTKQSLHKECIGKKKQEPVPNPPPRKPENTSKCRAVVEYRGNPDPGRPRKALKFDKDAVIEVLQRDDNWWKGNLHGEEGWFPAHLVQEQRQMPRRQPSYLDWKVPNAQRRSTQGSPISPNLPSPATCSPQGYVNVNGHNEPDYSKYNWYVGPLQRESAAEKLKRVPDGSFLLRDSTNPSRRGNPALSIKYSGTVRHIKIEKNQENMYFMADTKFFHSLPELVEYYQSNTLSDSFPEVQTTLLYPYKTVANQSGAANGIPSSIHGAAGGASTGRSPHLTRTGQRILSYARAEYDYAATATTQITLKHGDRVAVLSKTGSDKGWWKGEHCDSHRVGYFPYAYVREEDEE